jgi:hypothetical protein
MPSYNEIIAIETPVTDYLYDEARADKKLRDEFFQYLNPERPPRKGDNLLKSAEEWQEKLLSFATKCRLDMGQGTVAEKGERARDIIFGKPLSIEPGGSLANTFDTLVKATINGMPLTDGRFITAIGEGLSGEVFAKSLPGKLIHPEPKGRQLEAHVFPVDGDRILVSLPSFANPSSNCMSARQLDEVVLDKNTKTVMLGGYMKLTGKYNEFLDAVLNKVEAVSEKARKRPTIVLTLAAQDIAASQDLKDALKKASQVAFVTIFGNTGEFRRLLDLDDAWRKPHKDKWNGLAGAALENAKEADPDYQADKRAANDVAYRAAFERYCKDKFLPVTFVVTNGKKGVHVVNADGVSENYEVPDAPHGVVDTVGGGDGALAGYVLADLMGLEQRDCISLSCVCAGEIIGKHEARLFAKEKTCSLGGCTTFLQGLPAYLPECHEPLLMKLNPTSERSEAGKDLLATPLRLDIK